MLEVLLTDDSLAWTLGPDGTWTKVRTERGIEAQHRLQEMAVERAGSERGERLVGASSARSSSQVPAGFRLPELRGDGLEAAEQRAERLVTTYVDTADLRIVRWGCSLRHRRGEGWTVKLPAAADGARCSSRTEHVFDGRAVPGSSRSRPPICVRAFVRGAELAPVARLQTRRAGVEVRGRARSAGRARDRRRGVGDGWATSGLAVP